MAFTHEIRVGGSYSLDTHIRLQPPFKIQLLKLRRRKAPPLSPNEKTSESGERKIHVSAPCALKGSKKAEEVRVEPEAEEVPVVRRGAVGVKECGLHPRNWFHKVKWLALTETQLTLYPSENKALRSCIPLCDVAKVERTDIIPYGLALQTKDGKRYLLAFENDGDLYGWQDDISQRSMGVSLPWNFEHQTHASLDPLNGISGLPEGWDKVLNCSRPDPPTSVVNSGHLEGWGESPTSLVKENNEREPSLVIRGATPPLQYVSPIHSLSENIQEILERVCPKIGLDAAENVLVLAGDSAPLADTLTVADLQGKYELAVVGRSPAGDETSATPSPAPSEPIFLRIRIEISLHDGVHIATTIPVTAQMQIQDVLALICWKTKYNAQKCTLMLAGDEKPLDMDHTVVDLEGQRELVLVTRGATLKI
ncbi:hypothetical protein C8R44DRAFT_984799 [Mycena epipterygia]|nr:hypothetical protein C8R44DRAFT_984799 [Mycena epipterygia]